MVSEVRDDELRHAIRLRIWRLLEEAGVARFPRPVYGRIPNFLGAERAAESFAEMDIFRRANVVKVNPDSPQRHVRYLVLKSGKKLVMPTPRIKEGFLLLDPSEIPVRFYREAATIAGAFRWGKKKDPRELPRIDLIVAGSVAVDRWGGRLGKGEGYSEIEYAVLAEVGKLNENTPIVTTVHDLQVVQERIPLKPWDITVDYIVTPTRILESQGMKRRPKGILWDLLDVRKIREIPVLQELKESLRK